MSGSFPDCYHKPFLEQVQKAFLTYSIRKRNKAALVACDVLLFIEFITGWAARGNLFFLYL